MTSHTPIPVIIDTDPGLGEPGSDIDDGLAIALALRSAELEVLGLTIVNGNVDALTGTDVARRLTARLGHAEVPVILGAQNPLVRDMRPVRELFETAVPSVSHTRADDGPLLGPTRSTDAADWMIEQVAMRPGEIVIIAIGPMTNLAVAISRDPDFARNVGELVLMAGSATTYAQNITVVGDFNAYVDPEALDIVMKSGANITMVGLDQTSQVMLTRQDAAALRAAEIDQPSGFASWVADCTDAWIDFLGKAFPLREEHLNACFLHDPLVVAAVIDRKLCTWHEANVQVETSSELARGLVVANRGLALEPMGTANASVAVATDVDAFRDLFLSRMSMSDSSAQHSNQ